MGKTPIGNKTHQEVNFGKLLEPGLRKLFYETFDEVPEQYSKVFKVHNSKKAREVDYGLGAMPVWSEFGTAIKNDLTGTAVTTGEMPSVNYVTIPAGLERVYVHKEFAQGFMVERKFVDDEQYNVINKMPKDLARAGRYKVETDACSLLSGGFTNTGYDSKPLFSASHSLLSGGSCSNLVTGELNQENLQKAILLMKNIKDEAGKKVVFKADTLVIPPALEFRAIELLNSTNQPDGELNNINSIKGKLKIVVLDFLTTDTEWYVMDSSRHELNFFWRVRPEFKREEDFDTLVSKYRGYMRYSYGYSDWRGIVGSKGTSTYGLEPASIKEEVVQAKTKKK